MATKAARMRALLDGDRVIRLAGAHDGLSAQLAERHGFEAIWASGLGISAVHAVPDASILTMAELLSAAVVINDSCSLPVIADCDSGFGNIHNVARMVRKYETAGIAGVCIEDKVYPKVNSFADVDQDLIPVEEFCAKIRTAKATQNDPDFVVVARVEALISGLGIPEAIHRALAYAEAGADAILIHSKRADAGEIAAFMDRWTGSVPVVVVPTKYPSVSEEELQHLGVRVVIYANQALRASLRAMDLVFGQIDLHGSALPIEKEIATVSEVFALQGLTALEEMERRMYVMRSSGGLPEQRKETA
jgi:phosphoenolpyruvate phosphomutase